MNQHLTDGELRAALDGEQNATAWMHLDGCESCQQRQSQINAQRLRVAALFSPPARNQTPEAYRALRRFHLKYGYKEIPMFKKLLASNVFRYAALAVLLLAVTFSFPQTQAFAAQVLSLFRVQQVKVLPIDFSAMQAAADKGTIGDAISQMLSDSVTSSDKPGEPVDAADAAQASQLAGFTVRLPAAKTPANINVQYGGSVTFAINQEKAQTLLNEAGRSDLQLPPSIHGKEVSITIPTLVRTTYGSTCTPTDKGATDYEDCISLVEVPSPTIQTPAELDVKKLVQTALEFTGMSSEEASNFTNSVDWTTTLVIPVPRYANYQQISVDGVNGTLIEAYTKGEQVYSLIWVKDGIIYNLSGQGDSATAIELANSLQ